jgi:hypothetical protein
MSLCSFIDTSSMKLNPDLKPSIYDDAKPSTSYHSVPTSSTSSVGTSSFSTSPVGMKHADLHAQKPSRRKCDSLARDWALLLNNRNMSDVTVYVSGEHALRAHKLVIYARCPAMLEVRM